MSSPLGMDLFRITKMLNGWGGRPCRDMTHAEVMAEIGHEWGVEWRARAQDVSFPELLETLGACALSGVFPHSTQAMMAYIDGSVRRADFAATVPTADKVRARPHPHATPSSAFVCLREGVRCTARAGHAVRWYRSRVHTT